MLGSGLIHAPISPQDWILGSNSPIVKTVLTDGDWLNFLPAFEGQFFRRFDSMACFEYNAPVLMEDFSYKAISHIKIGEYVFTHTGQKKRVIGLTKRQSKEPIYQIKIKGLYNTIRCTPKHPILTERGWVEAEKLKKDDYVFLPTCNLTKDFSLYEVEKNKDFLWFLGLYLAEGSIGKESNPKDNNPKLKVNGYGKCRGQIYFSLNENEQDIADRIIYIGENLLGTKFNIHKKKHSKAMSVYGYNVFLRDLLEELGGKLCGDKKINKRLMFLNPQLQLEIFKGWADGDGSQKGRRFVGVSISENLIIQMHRILLRNNIKCSITKRPAYGIHKEAYCLHVYGTELNKLFNLKLENNQIKKEWFKNNCLLKKIYSIEIKNNNKGINVYNLEVEEDHSYIVNSVAVHNCVSFATNNALEMIFKATYGVDINFSDRALAKMSGTTKKGNTFQAVPETVRIKGVCLEELWPYPIKDGEYSWDEYYRNIPDYVIADCLQATKEYEFTHEWVHESKFKEALKYSPIVIAVNAWYRNEAGEYINPSEDTNHAVVLIGFNQDRMVIYDSYQQHIKILAKGYNIYPYGKIFNINRLKENNMEIKDNHLYKLVEGKIGMIGLGLNGRLITHSPQNALEKLDVLIEFETRNKGFINEDIGDKIISVQKDFWDDCVKVNLKGEKMN